MPRPAKKAKRAAQTAAATAAARAARLAAAGDNPERTLTQMMRAGAAAGAPAEVALPPADVGVPLDRPIEEHGAQIGPEAAADESMTQREEGADVTMEQSVDEGHGTGTALGAPLGSQGSVDSDGDDLFLMQMAEEEEAALMRQQHIARAVHNDLGGMQSVVQKFTNSTFGDHDWSHQEIAHVLMGCRSVVCTVDS